MDELCVLRRDRGLGRQLQADWRISHIRGPKDARSEICVNDSGSGTHHVLENVAQLIHTIRMVTPDFMHRLQEPLPFLALLHGVLFQSGRKGWEDCLLRKAIKVLDDEVPDAIVEHLAVLTHYQLVTKPVTFLEGKLVRIVMLDFTDVQGKLRPRFVNGNIWAMLDRR